MQTAQQLKQHKRRLKKHRTQAEIIFADRLRAAGILFKEQMILGFYILDFCIPDKLIAVELDGGWHDGRERYDERRDRFIEACGFTVIRIPNDQAVTFDLGCIFTEITKDVKQFRSALAKANSKRGTYLLSN